MPIRWMMVSLGLTGIVPILAQGPNVRPAAPIAASATTVVPALLPFSASAESADGKPLTGDVEITFLLFKDETGGDPIWVESQTVSLDGQGRYSVQLGASSPSGMPLQVFASGEVRWLEVQVAGQKQQPRVLLSSVPYALKAADAATLGGLPASAFALANQVGTVTAPSGVTPDAATNVTTTGGTADYLPKFNGASTVVNSSIYDTGTSVGVGGIPNSSARLDVNGAMIMRGNMQVTRTGNATASKGYPSYGFDFFSNVYNSSTKTTDNPYFQLQSEPTGNNTSSPSATFNLLFSNNGSAPAETGLYINPNGSIHFASSQTFPGGPGQGTITGVTAGTDLTGGGTSGNVTLNLNTSATDARYAQLGAGNSFSGENKFTSSNSSPAIYAYASAGAGTTNAIIGSAATGSGTGVFGSGSNLSNIGSGYSADGYGAGVWGDSSNLASDDNYAVLGTSDNSYAGFFINDSSSGTEALHVISATQATQTGNIAYFDGAFGECIIDVSGGLFCSGTKSAVVPVDNSARKVALYAVEAPENWFEDFGTGDLKRGSGKVTFEPVFAQTVNLGVDYHVFLTPNGDCKGLYVANKTATGFEVRESGNGRSTLSFDYRIVARRKGYETVRLADKTKEMDRSKSPAMKAIMAARAAK